MTRKIPHMQDMRRSREEKREELTAPPSSQNDYPYGLCISLCDQEIEKLGLEDEDVEPGDMLHLHCLAKVISVSENANKTSGSQCRIELQITHISAVEDEDEENESEEEEEEGSITSKLYI